MPCPNGHRNTMYVNDSLRQCCECRRFYTEEEAARALAWLASGEPRERKPHVHAPSQEEFLRALDEVGGSAHLEDLAMYFDISDGTARRCLDGLVTQGRLSVTRRPSVYTLVRS